MDQSTQTIENHRCIGNNKNNQKCRTRCNEDQYFCCEAHKPKNLESLKEECRICCEIVPESEVIVLRCGHAQHKYCYFRWINKQPRPICPICLKKYNYKKKRIRHKKKENKCDLDPDKQSGNLYNMTEEQYNNLVESGAHLNFLNKAEEQYNNQMEDIDIITQEIEKMKEEEEEEEEEIKEKEEKEEKEKKQYGKIDEYDELIENKKLDLLNLPKIKLHTVLDGTSATTYLI